MCTSRLESHDLTRTIKLRKPSFWNEKSWTRFDCQSRVCNLVYRSAGDDAVYGVETRHCWYHEDGWYVNLSVTTISTCSTFPLSHSTNPDSNIPLTLSYATSYRPHPLPHPRQLRLSVLGRHPNDASQPRARARTGCKHQSSTATEKTGYS